MLRSWRYWGLLLTTVPVFGASVDEVDGKLRSVIQAQGPGAQVSAPERSPVSGSFQTSIDGVSGYVSADGRYFVVGGMLDLASRTNVTEERRKERRRGLLRQVAPGEAIEFGAAKAKHTVLVFTDVDCPYCRKFHEGMGELEAKGIAVRYLAFPRSGPGTKAWRTMVAVWCAKDRREALTRATRGEEVEVQEGRACSDAVIAKQYALGQQLGIPGTPMIVMSYGRSLGGYVAPDKLLAAIEERAAERTNGMSGKSREQ
jgi:thiol:disulfide interchange protein DsbC